MLEQRLDVVGKLDAAKALRFAGAQTKIKKRLVRWGCRAYASDVIWAWIAETQTEGDERLEGLVRYNPGVAASPMPRWEWVARVKSGWSQRGGMTAALM